MGRRFAKVAICLATALVIPLCMQYVVPFASELPEHAVTTKSSDTEIGPMAFAPERPTINPQLPCPTDQGTGKQFRGVSWRVTDDGSGVCTLHVSAGTLTGSLTSTDGIGWKTDVLQRSITAVSIDGDLTITPSSGDGDYLFNNLFYMKTFTATKGFHLRGLQNQLFGWDISLEHIYGMETWDTTGTTDMSGMFVGCQELVSVNLTKFDTRQVTSISLMFASCPKMTSVDLSSFDTSLVTNMYGVFLDSGFTNLDLRPLKTANVVNMQSLVDGCKNLTSVNVSSFQTSKVTDMSRMFANCPNLTVLDLSSFDTSSVDDIPDDPDLPEFTEGMQKMLPTGLKILKLGDKTKLYTTAFDNVPPDRNWVRATTMEDKYDVIAKVGKTSDLAAVANGPTRAGIYRSDWSASKITLTIIWANGEADQTVSLNAGAPYTVPGLSGHRNPDGQLFSKWTLDTNQFTGQLVPNGTVTFNDNIANPNVKLTATWEVLESPTVKVVHTVAPQRQTPTVDLQSTASRSPKNNDEIRVWSTTGAPQQAKLDRTYPFNENQNPFSFTGVDAGTISPKPGGQYELHTTEARVDQYTGNKVISKDSITSGTLPYTTVTYSGKGSTSGTPPAPVAVYTETDLSGKPKEGKITLPLLASESAGGMKNSNGVLWGWSPDPNAPYPDAYMKYPDIRDYGVVAYTEGPQKNTDSSGHTDLVLYPVWRTPLLPDLNSANFKTNSDGTITMDGIKPDGLKPDFKDKDKMVLDNDGYQWKPTDLTNGSWSATSSQPIAPGKHTITATVTVLDEWREGGTPSNPVKAVFKTSVDKTIADNGVSSMPLTGGMPQKLAIMIAAGFAVALMLVAAARFLRNRRQVHAR